MVLLSVVLKQTLVMAFYMLLGFILFRTKKLSNEGSKSVAAVLIWLVIPAVVLNSFCTAYSTQKLVHFGQSTLLGAVALMIAMVIARLFYKDSPVDQFAAAFSNAGFMGIPLVKASIGDDAVFFLVGFVAMLNFLQWTYGASVLHRDKVVVKIKQIVLNPIFLAAIIGFLLFSMGVGNNLPIVISGTVSGITALNGPLAMIVLGAYLAQTDLKSMVSYSGLYQLCAVRLLLIPVLTLLVLWPLPIDPCLKLAILTAASAPVGSNVAVYAQLYGADYQYACQTVALSTVLSVITLPIILGIGSVVFQLVV